MKKLTKILLFTGLTLGIVAITSITTAILITKNKSSNNNDGIIVNKLSIIDNTNLNLKITTNFAFNNSKTTLKNNNLSIYFDSITMRFDNLIKPISLTSTNLILQLSFAINKQSISVRFLLPNDNINSIILNPNEQCIIVGLELSVSVKFDPLQVIEPIVVSYKELKKK